MKQTSISYIGKTHYMHDVLYYQMVSWKGRIKSQKLFHLFLEKDEKFAACEA